MTQRTLQTRTCLPLVLALLAGAAMPRCHAQQTVPPAQQTVPLAQQTLPPMVISTDKASGVYQIGDTVHWTLQWKGDAPAPSARYVLKSGSATEVAHGDLTFSNGTATLDSKMPTPNTLLLEVD